MITETDYRAVPALSGTGIATLLRSPAVYRWKLEHPEPSTPAQALGTLAHALALGTEPTPSESPTEPEPTPEPTPTETPTPEPAPSEDPEPEPDETPSPEPTPDPGDELAETGATLGALGVIAVVLVAVGGLFYTINRRMR